jgi:hypothetical protein
VLDLRSLSRRVPGDIGGRRGNKNCECVRGFFFLARNREDLCGCVAREKEKMGMGVLSPGEEKEKGGERVTGREKRERGREEKKEGKEKKEREKISSGFLMRGRWDKNEILCGRVVGHSVLHPVLINIVVLIYF